MVRDICMWRVHEVWRHLHRWQLHSNGLYNIVRIDYFKSEAVYPSEQIWRSCRLDRWPRVTGLSEDIGHPVCLYHGTMTWARWDPLELWSIRSWYSRVQMKEVPLQAQFDFSQSNNLWKQKLEQWDLFALPRESCCGLSSPDRKHVQSSCRTTKVLSKLRLFAGILQFWWNPDKEWFLG